MSDLRTTVEALFRGDAAAVLQFMTATPVVQDQRLGRLVGADEVTRWVQDSSAWLDTLKAKPTEVSVLTTDRRLVYELSLSIESEDGVVDLPYVMVADQSDDGFTEIRTYHSTWPYTKGHVFRPPPLAGRAGEPMNGTFQWYIDRISVADVQPVLDRFTDDGYVREPSGDRWKHQGPKELAAFYVHLVHAPRARFELGTCTVMGSTIAVEYAFAYGPVEFVGGVCIMEVDGDKIAAVRIADDVSA